MKRSTAVAVSVVLSVGLLATPAAATNRHSTPTPGAPGIGDPLFPGLGNGGYDARRYDLSLIYPTATPEQRVPGSLTMVARATQSLSSFNLDYRGGTIADVRVGGRPATWQASGEELVVTPAAPIAKDATFETTVRFVGAPFSAPEETVPVGWFTTADGSVIGAQPDRAHTVYPVNDHPADKATYVIRLDVPAGVEAVANGDRVLRTTVAGRTRSIYSMAQPMASELVQIAVGQLDVIQRGIVEGVRIRDVAATTLAKDVESALARTPDQMRWMVERAGAYPFSSYGSLVADREFFYALETQTLSLFPSLVASSSPEFNASVMMHELAHQWYGNSVAPKRWSDLWLNEGHATWYEWLYGDEYFGATDPEYALLPRVRAAYEQGDRWRAQYGPVARPRSGEMTELFSPNVYDGGAVVLYALRQQIGKSAFGELQRRWAQENAGKSITTDEFIAFASRVTGRDLAPFLRDWVYGTKTPPMPGHPDWTVLPPDTPLPTAGHADARTIEHPFTKR